MEDEDDDSDSCAEGGPDEMNDATESEKDVRYIGPITEEERLEKVRKYLKKKHNKAFSQKFCYTCRKQVAEKRLRIKGRFVTRE